MIFVIIDTKKDKKFKNKEYPFPMEVIEETEHYYLVINSNNIEKIEKNNILKDYKIFISKKEFKKIK